MKIKFLYFFLLLSMGAFAQGQLLRGFVYEQNGGAPVPYANVVVEGTGLGATTNMDGYFQISDVPVGALIVRVSFLGFETASQEVRTFKNKPTLVKFLLEENSQMLQTVDLNIERAEKKVKVNTAVVNLNPNLFSRWGS
jgi:hypothetical protein